MKWSELTEPAEVAKGLGDLYRLRGSNRYDEAVNQTEHALQCAWLAMAGKSDDATVVAALLHDVGHLLIPAEREREEDRQHEMVASRFLSRWFGRDVLRPIEMHVAAKRYLCAVEPPYFATLSPASVRSLELQGGPMGRDEVVAFEQLDFAEVAISLRRWDDAAKVPNAPTPTLELFEGIVREVLCAS
ncbi:MAG: HD domain-containing protein [Actinomycetota bacterium]|nr:HD domain-containing protein [Actinomycetota bacterium]